MEEKDYTWELICNALKASELPLKKKEDGSWYAESIASDSDYISVTPIARHGNAVYGTVSWMIRGQHLSGSYKDYDRFCFMMDAYLEEAGIA